MENANKNINIEDAELNNILAEVEANDFCSCNVSVKEKRNSVKIDNNSNIKKQPVEKTFTKNNGMDKKTAIEIAKCVALMVATGLCGYLELMSPILYIPIEIVSLCTVCFKLGEFKGKACRKIAKH